MAGVFGMGDTGGGTGGQQNNLGRFPDIWALNVAKLNKLMMKRQSVNWIYKLHFNQVYILFNILHFYLYH